jgi:hypothetical protein
MFPCLPAGRYVVIFKNYAEFTLNKKIEAVWVLNPGSQLFVLLSFMPETYLALNYSCPKNDQKNQFTAIKII